MAPPSSLDDPEAVNAFLARMGRDARSAMAVEPQSRSTLNPESTAFSPHKNPEPTNPENTYLSYNVAAPLVQQQEPRPAWQQSSQSPFPQAATMQKTNQTELIQDENGFVAEVPAPVLTPQNRNILKSAPQARPMTPTQYRLLKVMRPGTASLTEQMLLELKQQTEGYYDKVVEKFRHPNQAEAQATFNQPVTPVIKQEKVDTPDSLTFPEFDETPINPEVGKSSAFNASETTSKNNEWLEEKSTPILFNTSAGESGGHSVAQEKKPASAFPAIDETPINKSLDNMKLNGYVSPIPNALTNATAVQDEPMPSPAAVLSTKEQKSPKGGVIIENKSTVIQSPVKGSDSPTIVVTGTDTDTDIDTEIDGSFKEEDEEEDRENLTRFKTWGTPTARKKPKSRQRTIILSGLPRTDDLAFVLSFIHGGAIECVRLVPGNPDKPTISAHFTFTSADSCDDYYDKYPNGFDVRHQGKKWPVVVNKKDGVDVVSGMLQGYLDCGASRVVKVSNADDDWGVVALNKLAKGKNSAWQVEAVQDTYHGGTRIITFRFGNISHAVQFKGMIIRSDDWEGSHVEFAEDPCAKATSFRND